MASIAFALPMTSGAMEMGPKFIEELTGSKSGDHHGSSKAHGITRIKVFRQHTPHDMIVVYLEGRNIESAMAAVAKGESGFDKWFGGQVESLTGSHPRSHGHAAPAELLFDWHPEHGHSTSGHPD